MKRFPSTLTLAVALLLTVSAAALTVAALSALAQPSRFELRRKAIDLAIAEAARLAPRASPDVYGQGAVCNGPLGIAASRLRAALINQVQTLGASVVTLNVSPTAEPAGPSLSGMNVVLVASGSYERAVRLVALMDRLQPAVFIDQADLVPREGQITLTITGRAFCWSSDRR